MENVCPHELMKLVKFSLIFSDFQIISHKDYITKYYLEYFYCLIDDPLICWKIMAFRRGTKEWLINQHPSYPLDLLSINSETLLKINLYQMSRDDEIVNNLPVSLNIPSIISKWNKMQSGKNIVRYLNKIKIILECN